MSGLLHFTSSLRICAFIWKGWYALVLSFLLLGCGADSSDYATQENSGVYEFRESTSPEGTGRFYMGREIAEVVGHTGANWMERPSREAQEFPSRVIQALDVSPGDIVADIGAGTGYFTFRIAPEVPYGKVFAVDIDPEMIELISVKVKEQGIENVEPILGTETDPNLPENSVDVALIVDAYHEFSHPKEMVEKIRDGLKPGGRLVLVEYRGEDNTIPVSPLHRMTEEQARREMGAVGLNWRDTKDFLPQQHILVFEKPLE